MFHKSQKKHRLFIGGNRSGKTVSGCTEDIWWLTGKHPYRPEANYAANNGGCRGRIIGVDFTNVVEKSLIPEIARWIPPSSLINGSWADSYSKGLRVLTLANGSTLEFMSYEQDLDKFSSTSRHFVHMDEEPPQDIYTENTLRLMDTAGSWWMTLTPIEGMVWMYDDIYMKGKNNPDGNIDVIEVDSYDNPFLNKLEIDSVMADLAPEEVDARIHGKFIRRGGLVFKTFDPAVHVIDPMIPPKNWTWYCSVDHGFNNPTAWLWHAVSPDNVVVTFSEHYAREMTVNQHANVVQLRNAALNKFPDYFVGDPALAQRNGVTGTSIFQEYQKEGIYIMPGNNDVSTGINRINNYLRVNKDNKPQWFITRNCENLIHEMQRLRWKTWASKKTEREHNVFDEIHKKDDHACDSARYFFTMLPDLAMIAPTAPKNPNRINEALDATPMTPIAGSYDEVLAKSIAQAQYAQETKWAKETADISVGVW